MPEAEADKRVEKAPWTSLVGNRRFRVALIAVIAFSAALPLVISYYRTLTREGDKEAIRELLLRKEMADWDRIGGFGVYYTSIEGGRDPSGWLLSRFRGHKPPAVPFAGARYTPDRVSAIILEVTKISFVGPDGAFASYGYHDPSSVGAGTVNVWLVRVDGRWGVKEIMSASSVSGI